MSTSMRPFRFEPWERSEADHLVRSGLLRCLVGDVHVAVDVPVDPVVRAQALALLLPPRLLDPGTIIAQEAAVWLFAGGAAPESIDVIRSPGSGRAGPPGVRVHERRLADDQVVAIGPLRVTCAARTAADIAGILPGEAALDRLGRLAAATGIDPAAVLALLDTSAGGRGVRRARTAVLRWRSASPP